MADQQDHTTTEPTATTERQQEPQGTEPQTDWKAESRKWERRSKENAEKARNYDALKEAQKTELEKANDRAAKAEAEAEALREQKAHADLVAKVSAETGVPAALIHGADENEMTASAKAVAEWAKSTSTVAPTDKGGAAQPKHQSEESIRKMKSPIDRIEAYAREYKKN